MMNSWFLISVSLAYLGLLFFIAHFGDQRAKNFGAPARRPLIYSLALTIYCTSWSFYGTIGQTAATGWIFPPTYVGSIILFVILGAFLNRLVSAGKKHNISSVADFISSRYGKSHSLATLVTLLATACVVPYIALQLKAVASTFEVMKGDSSPLAAESGAFPDTAFFIAAMMAFFSILFGTRRIVSTDHNHGLMLAIAFESIFKLFAFAVIGFFVLYGLFDGIGDLLDRASEARLVQTNLEESGKYAFLASLVLGITSMFCLPRQFHVLVVENVHKNDVNTSRWLFPLYLVLMGMFIWPIAMAGLTFMPQGASAEYFPLTLPLATDHPGIALIVYLGGLSAATSMVIVSTVALSIMVSNDVIVPTFLKDSLSGASSGKDLSPSIRLIRRGAVVVVLFLAYLYYRLFGNVDQLASIGLLSMALAAQFAPPIVGGVFWKAGNRKGATAGLLAGFVLWLYTLLLPTIASVGFIDEAFVEEGPFGLSWLSAHALFGLDRLDSIAHGLFWSLLANIFFFVTVSYFTRSTAIERLQSVTFTEFETTEFDSSASENIFRWDELRSLIGKFIGQKSADEAFDKYLRTRGRPSSEKGWVDRESIAFAERLLAGAIGAASARVVLRSASRGDEVKTDDVITLADEASRVFRFNRDLLQASMDNVSTGIALVDKHLRLVAWNKAYADLYAYPPGFLYEGRHVRDLIRYNAECGECGPGDPEEHVRKRLKYMEAGSEYMFQRERRDGSVIEIRGKPMPGGGFVTSYTDITRFIEAERALKEVNESLERRVSERTKQLTRTNIELSKANAEAKRANESKTRFFAAVSHDVLQPLNAARLFSSAIRHEDDVTKIRTMTEHLEKALDTAQDLLADVLDLSKLDAGGVAPEMQNIPLAPLFDELQADFQALAMEKGLTLRVVQTSLVVHSDRQYLRRILQNLLSNAIRYTERGGVLMGVRRRGASAEIEVWDTGLGIPESNIGTIFGEFNRVRNNIPSAPKGLGLGLAIVERIGKLLDHPISVRSQLGSGSVFSVTVPICRIAIPEETAKPPKEAFNHFQGARILCIDNDTSILEGMKCLLDKWACETLCVHSYEEAVRAMQVKHAAPDLVIADYHLDGADSGIETVRRLMESWGESPPCIVISADRTEGVKKQVREAGYRYLAKPVKVAALKALMTHLLSRDRPTRAMAQLEISD